MSGSGVVCCHNAQGRVRTTTSIPDPKGEGVDLLFAQARVYCNKNSFSSGITHKNDMTFSISPIECWYFALNDMAPEERAVA